MIFEILYRYFHKPLRIIKSFLQAILQIICPHMLFNCFWRVELFSDEKMLYYRECMVCGRKKEIVNNIVPFEWK